MIAEAIRFVLTNLPTLLFVAAIVIAFATRRPASLAERLLAWLLLLSVGVERSGRASSTWPFRRRRPA